MILKDEVKHIAKLARLGITEEEEEKFQKDLSSILDYFEMLKELDTLAVEPTHHPTEKFMDNGFRKDEIRAESEEDVDSLIALSPEKEKRHIKVKAILS